LHLFRISIFGFRIYHTMNVYSISPYRVEPVPGPLDPGIYSFVTAGKEKSMTAKNSCTRWMYGCILFVAMLFAMGAGSGFAGEAKDMGGWELGSTYNQYYDASEMDRIRCTVKKVTKVVPLKGMAPALALLVEESKGDTTLVHVCPEWYLGSKDVGIRKGDALKIKGVWAEINDEFIFMASKIKKGDYFVLKVRLTKDGKPFWTMDPEELAREIANTE